MTTTLPPPAPAPAAGPPPAPPMAPGAPSSPGPGAAVSSLHLLLTEILLAALTCAAVFSFARIFASWSFLAPLLVVAVAGHTAAVFCRRRGFGVAVSFAIVMVEWLLVVTWLFFLDTTFALVPTPDTWSTARLELDRSWASFHHIVAPAPVQTGFLLAAAAAVAGGAFLADWAAFRLWSAREALVPSITLFVFATLLADDRYREVSAVAMVLCALAFVLAHRVATLERSDGWVGHGRARAGRSLLAAGAGLTVVAIVIGMLVAPHLPGVDEEPLVDWRHHSSGSNARMLQSPLVDIRSRLVDTSDTPLFTIESPVRSYLRIASLDQFDGTQWRLQASTDEIADGGLGVDRRVFLGDASPVTQVVTIQQLETSWLPAAFQPVRFTSLDDSVVRYDFETATLISDEDTQEGTSYEVTSILPDHTPEELRSASPVLPRFIRSSLRLPEDFSPTAERIALEETAGETTNYDKALALQNYFRETGGFTYNTDVTLGQGTDAIDEFLQEKVGYCEQFAGAFAAMARSVGIPARVAVGYTWGQPDPDDSNRYQILGRNAHAWPEVYLGGYGWVPFEPTPGRGNPDATSYTGVPGAQVGDAASAATTTTVASEAGATTTTTAAPGDETASDALDRSGTDSNLLGTARTGVLVVLAAAALFLLAVPGSLAVRRRRRRTRAAGSPGAEVGVAWIEVTEGLTAIGVRARPDETHTELAARASEAVPPARAPLTRLAATADAAAYGPTPTATDGDTALHDAAEVEEAVEASLGRVGRIRRFLDPRPLWEGRARRHRTG